MTTLLSEETRPTDDVAANRSTAPAPDADELQEYRRVSLAAMASVGLALVGLFGFIFAGMLIFPAIGILCAVMAFVSIRRYPSELTGKGLAATGLIASLAFLVGGVGYHGYVYATEVPDGMVRVGFWELRPDAETHPDQLISDRAIGLDGQQVFIKGYIHPSVDGMGDVRRFVLVPDMGTCCFGGEPKICDMVAVELNDSLSTKYNMRLRKVGGEFRVNPTVNPVPGIEGIGPGVAFQMSATHLK